MTRKVNFVKHGRMILIQVRSEEYKFGFVLVDPKTLHESEGGFDFGGNATWNIVEESTRSISKRARTVARFYQSGDEALLPEALAG